MKFIEALVAVAQRNAINTILLVSCNISLLTRTFDDLWQDLWGDFYGVQYRSEERTAKEKFIQIKELLE